MIKMYLKVALRNLLRNKFYTIINIAGLSIGMAVAILIFSYVRYEYSFDRFHSKSDQIYRVVQSVRQHDREFTRGFTGGVLASALKEEIPEILHITRLIHVWGEAEISCNGKKFVAKRGELVLADNDIFKIFDIEMIQGDPQTALMDPNSIILTQEESLKYFGNENSIGKFIAVRHKFGNNQDIELNLKVTGVVKSMPYNSHFSFKCIVPLSRYKKEYFDKYTRKVGVYTYVTLPVGFPAKNLDSKLSEIVKKYFMPEIKEDGSTTYDDWIASGEYWKLALQPLKNIYLDQQFKVNSLIKKGNIFNVQIYAVIALFIIILACINYITLSTARSGARAKEVGMRKVNGATRGQLIWQFLIESILLSVITLIIAMTLIKIFSTSFGELLEIQTSYYNTGIAFSLISLFVFTLFIGVIAGSYPAFFLSAFNPVNILNGRLSDNMKGKTIRNSLVTFQFMVSIILIISSITVYRQFEYMQNKELGFNKENIVFVKMYKFWLQDRNMSHKERIFRSETLLQEVLKNPNAIDASLNGNMPGKGRGNVGRYVRLEGATEDTRQSLFGTKIDPAYLGVFGLEMAAGKNFRRDLSSTQSKESIIINEKAANYLGLKNPIGKFIYWDDFHEFINDEGEEEWEWKEKPFQIIGVFKDFHNRGLHSDIQPAIFFPLNGIGYRIDYLAIKFSPGNISENIAMLEKVWDKMETNIPFEYSFFDKEFENMYNKEKKLFQVFTFFTILSIFIACLGIYGLVTLTAEQRTKEIGIRKVNGATINEVMLMLNKDFVKWVGLAFVIACPVAYYAMSTWLENFAYSTTLSWWVFALAGGFALVIALLTVSWQSYNAATRNPVEALRDE